LKAAGYNVVEAEVGMIPDNKVVITDLDTAKKVMALYEALDDLDDVNDVYSNFDISDDLLEQL
ncbi:MAG: YebC/PmpR family DNA-binding transcriptional regulator, partial [Cetobacterium sp.]